jgi:hypothetical protein
MTALHSLPGAPSTGKPICIVPEQLAPERIGGRQHRFGLSQKRAYRNGTHHRPVTAPTELNNPD